MPNRLSEAGESSERYIVLKQKCTPMTLVNQAPFSTKLRPRTVVYIDGFNFYHGVIKGTRHKWLDLQKFFERLRPDDDVKAIRYFTAEMAPPQGTRQLVYLQALATRPKVIVVLGRFKTKTVTCGILPCSFTGDRKFVRPEEKRTDVNIALAMLDDAYQNLADNFVIVSGDSDLVPALHMLKARFPEKNVIVYIPARDGVRGAAAEMRGAADRNKTLPLDLLSHSQFAATLHDGAGGTITKPNTW